LHRIIIPDEIFRDAPSGILGTLALLKVITPVLEMTSREALQVTSAPSEIEPPASSSAKPSILPSQPVAPRAVPRPVIVPTVSSPELVPPPLTALPEIETPLEELEFDNPFAAPPKKIKKKPVKKTPSLAKKTTPKKAKSTKRKPAKSAPSRAALARKVVNKASVISRSSPRYPKSAQRKKQQGKVMVLVTISPSGKVSLANVTRSSGVSALDSAAVKAARKFRFSPAQNALGQTVSSRKAIPFTFRL